MVAMKSGHNLSLDGLRGVAALVVFTFHLSQFSKDDLFRHGFLAVDFFFILSGFVVAHAYETPLLEGMSLRTFFWIRLRRLYPMALFGLSLGLVVTLMGWGEEPFRKRDLANLVLVPLIRLATRLYPLDVPMWLLFFELLVNVVHAALIRPLTRASRTGEEILFGVVLISGISCIAAAIASGSINMGYEAATVFQPSFLGAIPRIGFGYFAGVLMFRLVRDDMVRLPETNFLPVAGILVVVLCAPHVCGDFGKGGVIDEIVIFAAILPVLMLFAINAKVPDVIKPVAIMLGKLSFPLYVLHEPMGRIAKGVEGRYLAGDGGKWFWLASWIAIAGLCWIATILIDAPLQRMIKARRWRPA